MYSNCEDVVESRWSIWHEERSERFYTLRVVAINYSDRFVTWCRGIRSWRLSGATKQQKNRNLLHNQYPDGIEMSASASL